MTIFFSKWRKMWKFPCSLGRFFVFLRKNVNDNTVFLPRNKKNSPLLHRRCFDPKKSLKLHCSHFLLGGGVFHTKTPPPHVSVGNIAFSVTPLPAPKISQWKLDFFWFFAPLEVLGFSVIIFCTLKRHIPTENFDISVTEWLRADRQAATAKSNP